MAIDRKWVLYNTLTGVIIEELPVSDDSVYLDINNGDEATIDIAAYGMLAADRIGWTSKYKSWARGIALIDNTKAFDNAGAVIFAGPIVKRAFDGNSEMISLTAYSIYEYLKKITVPPVWTEITDATATETFTADSWAGIYSAVLQRGIDPTGKPAGLNFMNTFTGLPTVTGTGYSYTVKVIDQVKVSDVFEDIRDSVSANGNEFRFKPVFTSSAKTTLTWTLTVGTNAAPKLNYTDLTVPLYEEATPTHDWRATEYNIDDDNTLIYNKLVINGSTDPVTSNLEAVYDAVTDPDMPILTEKFDPGVTLTQPELDIQKAERILGSLIGDKNISLTIANDGNFDSFNYVGNKAILDASLSDKMAGTSTKARVVGISFTSSSRENEITLDLMKLQARYTKLPKDQTSDMLTGDGGYSLDDISFSGGTDFGNPTGDYGTGGGGFDEGGDTYIPPPVEPGTPEVTNPNMIVGITRTTSGTSDGLGTEIFSSNLTPEGFQYLSAAPAYNNSTDVISDISIRVRKITLNETANQEVKFNTEYVTASAYTLSGATLASYLTTPASVTYYTRTGTNTSTAIPTATTSVFLLNYWTIKNKLYILATKQKLYTTGGGTGGYPAQFRWAQKLFTLDINTSTGALSNLTPIDGKWGPTAITENENIFLVPSISNGNTSSQTFSYGPDNFKINDNEMLFMKVLKKYNSNSAGVYLSSALDIGFWSAEEIGYRSIPTKPVKVDFTATGAPLYTETAIVPPTPVPDTATPKTVWSLATGNIANYIDTIGEYYTTNDSISYNYNHATYIYHPTQNKIYCVTYGSLLQDVYTTNIDTLKDLTRFKVYVLDLGAGSTSFSQIGNSFESLVTPLVTSTLGAKCNNTSLQPVPLNDNLYLYVEAAGLTSQPSTYTQLTLKNGSWVEQRRPFISGSNTDSIITNTVRPAGVILKTSSGKDIALLNNLTSASSYLGQVQAYQEELSPYKVKCKYVTKYFVLDTTNKLWTFGTGSTDTNIWGSTAPKWSETTVPMKHPNNTSWKQIVTNYSYQANSVTLAIASGDNTLWAWGSNQNYLTGQAVNTGVTATPTQIGTKTWSKVVVGSTVVAALDTDGALYTWGTNGNAGLGQGTTSPVVNPTRVGTGIYIDLDIASTGLMVIDSNRDLYYTGTVTGQTTRNTLGILGSQKWKKVVTSDSHYMGITTADTLFALGSNAQGRTGLNTITGTATTWTQVGTDTWTDIAVTKNGATTYGASFGIKTDGSLWEWGYNGLNGIIGTGSTLVPNQAGTDTDWTAVFSDGYCVRSNGVAYSPTGLGSETWAGTLTSDWRTIFGGETG